MDVIESTPAAVSDEKIMLGRRGEKVERLKKNWRIDVKKYIFHSRKILCVCFFHKSPNICIPNQIINLFSDVNSLSDMS